MGLRHLHLDCRAPAATGRAIRPGRLALYDAPCDAGTPGRRGPRLLGVLTVNAAEWERVIALLRAGAEAQGVAVTSSGVAWLPASVRAAIGSGSVTATDLGNRAGSPGLHSAGSSPPRASAKG